MRGFTDRNQRRVRAYRQTRQVGQTWTGEPRRPRPPQRGAKLTAGGHWRNVKQTFTVPRFGRASPKPRRDRGEDRSGLPAQLAAGGAMAGAVGVVVTATASGLAMVAGVVVALVGAALGAWSLAIRAGWFE